MQRIRIFAPPPLRRFVFLLFCCDVFAFVGFVRAASAVSVVLILIVVDVHVLLVLLRTFFSVENVLHITILQGYTRTHTPERTLARTPTETPEQPHSFCLCPHVTCTRYD